MRIDLNPDRSLYSKNPDGPALMIDPAAWRTFTSRIKASEHDLI